jgi:hypothetical protein
MATSCYTSCGMVLGINELTSRRVDELTSRRVDELTSKRGIKSSNSFTCQLVNSLTRLLIFMLLKHIEKGNSPSKKDLAYLY